MYNTLRMPPECPYKPDVDPSLIAAYTATFIPRDDLYPLQLQDGRYIVLKHHLHPDIVVAHLKGFLTLGAFALSPPGWAHWVCIDADDAQQFTKLTSLATRLSDERIQPYLELSRRGGHLWLFTPPLPGFQARRFGKQLLAEAGIDGVELYPKQDRPTTGPGSFMRLPLGKHRLAGRRYHFITPDGEPLAPTIREQVALLADPQRVPMNFVDTILSRAPPPVVLSPTPRFPDADRPSVRSSSGKVSERIKQAVSVESFVGQYVVLDDHRRGHCPFHDDEHKSLQVNDEGNFWHCYAGCGGGSIIDFWMKWREKQGEDGTFKATVKDLARMLLKD